MNCLDLYKHSEEDLYTKATIALEKDDLVEMFKYIVIPADKDYKDSREIYDNNIERFYSKCLHLTNYFDETFVTNIYSMYLMYYYDSYLLNNNFNIINILKTYLKNEDYEDNKYVLFLYAYHCINIIRDEKSIMKGIKIYEDLVKRNFMEAADELGNYYKDKRNYEEMMKYYKICLEKEYISVYVNLGDYYKQQRNYSKMMEYYDLAILNGNPFVFESIGFYYENIKDIDNMKKYYLMGIEENDTTALYSLCAYYSDNKEYDNMIKCYDMYNSCSSKVIEHFIGLYYKDLNDIGNMFKHFKKGIDGYSSESMIAMGNYYKELNDFHDMDKYYEIAIKNYSNEVFYEYGKYYHDIHDNKNMQKYINIAINKDYNLGYSFLGNYYKDKDEKKMLNYYTKGCKNNDVLSIYYLGLYYFSKNDFTNSIKYFKISYDMNAEIYNTQDIMYLMFCYEKMNNIDNMIKYRKIGMEKNTKEFCISQGNYYIENDDHENAFKYYTLVYNEYKEFKEDMNIIEILIELCYLLDDYDGLKKYCTIAYNIDSTNFELSDMINNYIIKTKDYEFAYKHSKCLNNDTKKLLSNFITEYVTNYGFIEVKREECCICLLETNLRPLLNCTHYTCTSCYKKITECPLCREGL
jgi:hypothetical protein